MKEKQEVDEVKQEEEQQQLRTYVRDPKVPRSGHFFNFKIITLKDLQDKNIAEYKERHKL